PHASRVTESSTRCGPAHPAFPHRSAASSTTRIDRKRRKLREKKLNPFCGVVRLFAVCHRTGKASVAYLLCHQFSPLALTIHHDGSARATHATKPVFSRRRQLLTPLSSTVRSHNSSVYKTLGLRLLSSTTNDRRISDLRSPKPPIARASFTKANACPAA